MCQDQAASPLLAATGQSAHKVSEIFAQHSRAAGFRLTGCSGRTDRHLKLARYRDCSLLPQKAGAPAASAPDSVASR